MRLALRLGLTLDQVKQQIDSRELAQWLAFDQIDPISYDRVELILARFMALIANTLQSKGNATAADYLPHIKKAKTTDSIAEAENAFRGLFRGTDKPVIRKP